jgi:hypothetical protein
MEVTVKDINKNFVIRYKYNNDDKTYLIGAGKYVDLIGDEDLVKKHFNAAFNSGKHKYIIKLRRGLQVFFCSK